MGSLAVDRSLGAPYVEAVFAEGFCCESQLPFVVELAVSERVQSLVEEQRGDGYSESPFNERVSKTPRVLGVFFVKEPLRADRSVHYRLLPLHSLITLALSHPMGAFLRSFSLSRTASATFLSSSCLIR